MEKVLRFFVNNSRLNYLLFVMVFLAGIISYIKTPKEIFPSFDLDMVSVSGYYTGASIDMLDKMVVREIENDIKNVDGISKMATIINSGRFNIILELDKGIEKYAVADRVKDAIADSMKNLPSDMNEPLVKVLRISKSLMRVALTSKKLSKTELIQKSKELQDQITALPHIAEIDILGDSDIYYDIELDTQKIKAYSLDEASVSTAISGLSYIFPIGQVEDTKNGFSYISTANGPKDASSMMNTKIKVSGKSIRLSEIATIHKRHKDSATLFSVDTKSAISLTIKQSSLGNALTLSDSIYKLVDESKRDNPQINYIIHDDRSQAIKDRLNIVISNILLGLIMIFLLVMLLINSRMSFVITLGIPTSFVLGATYLYTAGYSINMISLIGVLIALGIIVDDAIVVSENIQQHIEEGMEPKEAAVQGAKEMFLPVTIASMTTLFAFLPALMMSGTMGQVIKLIPIAVSALVLASLVESFIFLPIHASHIFKKGQKSRSWAPINRIYSTLIHFFIKYRKSFLMLFLVLIPILTIISMKHSRFQMFPKFDASSLNIVLKASVNTTTEQTAKYLSIIEKDLYKDREKFYIDHIGSISGKRVDAAGNSEKYPYVGFVLIELKKLQAQTFVDKYITPTLSFYYDKTGRVREKKSVEIAKELRIYIRKKGYKERFGLSDIAVSERKVGPVKSDIKIGIISNDNDKVVKYIHSIKKELEQMKGIVSTGDSLSYGVNELKLGVNGFGESLGLNEKKLGLILSNLYLERKLALGFDDDNMLDFIIKRADKNSKELFMHTSIKLDNGTSVSLSEVASIKTIKSLEKAIKDNGVKNFYIYANVDSKIATATEVLDKLKTKLDEATSDGIKISLKGESEKKKDLKDDMMLAGTIALLLIMISILYLFNSFKETFMMMSVIPFSILGVLIGHFIVGINLSMPSIIGLLGLSGVVVNDGIIMVMNLKKAKDLDGIFHYAAKRFRPIILTSVTTVVGLATLTFFPTGQAAIFQPMAVSLAFGLLWGTVLNLLYLPVLYTIINSKRLGI